VSFHIFHPETPTISSGEVVSLIMFSGHGINFPVRFRPFILLNLELLSSRHRLAFIYILHS